LVLNKATQSMTTTNEPATGHQHDGRDKATIHARFRERAASNPTAAAILDCGAAVSYGELDRRSDAVAGFLASQGAGRGTRVATLLDRSADAVTALLGILKTGAAYVPLDPRAGTPYLAQTLSDCQPAMVLTATGSMPAGWNADTGSYSTVGIAAALEWARPGMANAPGDDGRSADPAYVMYTSGSTGRPKGVVIPHRAVVGLVVDNPFASFGPSETFMAMAPLAFDASTFELWGALLNGGQLAIMRAATPSPQEIGDAIAANAVTTLWLTAGMFHLMVDEAVGALRPLRQLLAGGDALSRPHVERALRELPGCRLINGYGPTENTTFSCCCTLTTESLGQGSVPVGMPVAGTEALVLDDALRPVADGKPGELHLGGEGLANGYLGMPELTAGSFIPHPLDATPGARLYRTGDMVRRRPDGNLEFLGRRDRQVKVNGHRVELDGVEAALRSLPGVLDAAATPRVQGAAGTRIDGFLVLSERSTEAEAAVRLAVRETLAPAMAPSAIVVLDRLPLTSNGKVDRAALSRLAANPPAPPSLDAAGPTDATERLLAEVWGSVLGAPVHDLDRNFFDLGGTSLELVRVQAELTRRLGAPVETLTLFEFPTIRTLSRRLRGEASAGTPVGPAPAQPANRAASYRQRMRNARTGAVG